MAQTRTEIASLLHEHGITPAHRLGQHFLADANITRRIAELAELAPGRLAIEIGAGTGTLTKTMASAGADVIAYEVDDRLEELLRSVLPEGVDLRMEDASRVDLESVVDGRDAVLAANLPYNVGTPILLDAIRFAPSIRRFVVMVQLEVAQRLTASPGSKEYGLPSVIASLHTTSELALKIPRQVFLPVPNVDSAVVVMERFAASPEAGRAADLASIAFNQRRKMLRRSLAGSVTDPVSALRTAGIDPTARPETLTSEDFLRLAEAT